MGLAYNQNMKRLVLSVLAGFVIPFAYGAMAFTLSTQLKSSPLDQLLGFPDRHAGSLIDKFGTALEIKDAR
jgi:hypothetical protein